MRSVWLLGLCLGVGCASAPVNPAPTVAMDAADAHLLQGCYDCLVEARDGYQRLAVGRTRPLVLRKLFEAELVIALRQKELGLDPAVALARADALARELPATLGADRYLEAAEAVPSSAAGWPRSELNAFLKIHLAFLQKIDEELLWIRNGGLTPVVAEYVALSLDCAYPGRPRPRPLDPTAARPAAETPPEGPPLLRYRRALCSRQQREALEGVRAEVPAFVDTSFVLGQIAVATINVGGRGNPHALVAEVQQRFPESPAVTYLAAVLQQTVAACGRALAFYDQTLALKPLHEEAWLGRTVCLTELKRSEEAIDAATRMVGLGLDNIDQALYWRAWNRHARNELELARTDIEATRLKWQTGDVLALAGIIEHDQDDLGPAERDLQAARRMSQGRNCRAESYLGSVFMKRQLWRDAAVTFESAMACYQRDIKGRESTLATVERNDAIDAQFKAAEVARLLAEIRTQRTGEFFTALNAANFYAATGELDKAKLLIEIAAKDPELSSQVIAVREYIGRLSARSPSP